MEIVELLALIKTGSDAQLYESLVAIDSETEWIKDCRRKIEAELNRRNEAKKIRVTCPQCEGSGQGTLLYGNPAAKYTCPTCDGKGFLLAMPWEGKP